MRPGSPAEPSLPSPSGRRTPPRDVPPSRDTNSSPTVQGPRHRPVIELGCRSPLFVTVRRPRRSSSGPVRGPPRARHRPSRGGDRCPHLQVDRTKGGSGWNGADSIQPLPKGQSAAGRAGRLVQPRGRQSRSLRARRRGWNLLTVGRAQGRPVGLRRSWTSTPGCEAESPVGPDPSVAGTHLHHRCPAILAPDRVSVRLRVIAFPG